MKKFVVPLQALAALALCGVLAWMVFLLVGLNPTPPSAMDLQARSTQDMSFASMNSTAVALARGMLADLLPSPSGPILMPVTGGGTPGTPSPTPVAVVTLKMVATIGNAPTPFSLLTNGFPPTDNRENPGGPAATGTYPPVPTRTSGLPTLTATKPASPTPPTPTRVATDMPTGTATGMPTLTPIPQPSNTPRPTLTPRPTNTPVPQPTKTTEPPSTSRPTSTLIPQPSSTPKPPPTPGPTDPPSTQPQPTSPPPTNPPPTQPPPTDPPSTNTPKPANTRKPANTPKSTDPPATQPPPTQSASQ